LTALGESIEVGGSLAPIRSKHVEYT
jgi:hypothetical protein